MLNIRVLITFMLIWSSIKAQLNADSCGVSSIKSTASIENGGNFFRGTWPWMVAILEKTQNTDKYFCTGTFILENKVLTGKFYQLNNILY